MKEHTMNTNENNALKVIVLIVVIAVSTFFIVKNIGNRDAAVNKGQVINVSQTSGQDQLCNGGVYAPQSDGTDLEVTSLNAASLKNDAQCYVQLSSCQKYSGNWSSVKKSCVTAN